jgi:hypothetical protein
MCGRTYAAFTLELIEVLARLDLNQSPKNKKKLGFAERLA